MNEKRKVTPEMISEDLRVYEDLRETYDAKSLVEAIYIAMVLADPEKNHHPDDETDDS